MSTFDETYAFEQSVTKFEKYVLESQKLRRLVGLPHLQEMIQLKDKFQITEEFLEETVSSD